MKHKSMLMIAFLGIHICLPTFAAEQKKEQPANLRFLLVCSSQLLKKIIAVDTAKKTIDGKPANFSDTTITWKTEEKDIVWKKSDKSVESRSTVLHELSRLEGLYRSRDEGASPESAITYNCEKAPPQRF